MSERETLGDFYTGMNAALDKEHARGFREAIEAAAKVAAPITMSDIRLCAGEGKLTAHTVLDAANAVLRQRARALPPDHIGDANNMV